MNKLTCLLFTFLGTIILTSVLASAGGGPPDCVGSLINSCSAIVDETSCPDYYINATPDYYQCTWNSTCVTGGDELSCSYVNPLVSTPNVWIQGCDVGTANRLGLNGSVSVFDSTITFPYGTAVDLQGNVYVEGTTDIVKLNSTGSVMATLPSACVFCGGIAVDRDGNVWYTDEQGDPNFVRKLDSNLNILGTWATVPGPYGVAVDRNNNIWVASNEDATNVSVEKLDSSGNELGLYMLNSSYYYQEGVAVDSYNNIWVVSAHHTDKCPDSFPAGCSAVTKVDNNGTIISYSYVEPYPESIAVDGYDNVWVPSGGGAGYNNTLAKISNNGTVLAVIGLSPTPEGVAVDEDENIWVNEYQANVTLKIANNGTILGNFTVDGGPESFGDFTGFALQYFVHGYQLPSTDVNTAPQIFISLPENVTYDSSTIPVNVTIVDDNLQTGNDSITYAILFNGTEYGSGWLGIYNPSEHMTIYVNSFILDDGTYNMTLWVNDTDPVNPLTNQSEVFFTVDIPVTTTTLPPTATTTVPPVTTTTVPTTTTIRKNGGGDSPLATTTTTIAHTLGLTGAAAKPENSDVGPSVLLVLGIAFFLVVIFKEK